MRLAPALMFDEGAVALRDNDLASLSWSAVDGTADIGGGDPVIVVGGGPAGLRVAHEVMRRGLPVVLFNAERWRPYNRVKLTSFLAGEVQIGLVYQTDMFPPGSPLTQYTGQSIVKIDRRNKTAQSNVGRTWRY